MKMEAEAEKTREGLPWSVQTRHDQPQASEAPNVMWLLTAYRQPEPPCCSVNRGIGEAQPPLMSGEAVLPRHNPPRSTGQTAERHWKEAFDRTRLIGQNSC
jgi:hypothetical protein